MKNDGKDNFLRQSNHKEPPLREGISAYAVQGHQDYRNMFMKNCSKLENKDKLKTENKTDYKEISLRVCRHLTIGQPWKITELAQEQTKITGTPDLVRSTESENTMKCQGCYPFKNIK